MKITICLGAMIISVRRGYQNPPQGDRVKLVSRAVHYNPILTPNKGKMIHEVCNKTIIGLIIKTG